ncbi:MAG: ribosome maturation factor RimM [Desulfobulbaceae bacterium]|jgi:16S rRNA processing protein RimM|nr:ribosome maturation factor RimM [Desulfobulbaceae bacterium]MDY0351493.1 ribosome maturation factor RimM [Desulfobulbaceae bacterium]
MTRTGIAAGDFILLGKITRPHGIRGEVKVHPYSGLPENFLRYSEIFIGTADRDERIPYTVEHCRIQGRSVLLTLTGCRDRDRAELLAGKEVWLRRGDLPEPDEDEFYLIDLIGRRAVTDDHRILGRITGILETGAHDILSVTDDGREYLIPLRKEFIVEIADQEVVLKLPPGLLEMNG